jgi:predicted RNA-binding protein with PUA-like domain
MVDIKAEALFRSPISLTQVKFDNELKDMVLAKNSRLSVQSVTPKEWKVILTMGMSE